ncbi:CASP8-associated protein 2 [Sinocyclocheilus anshuiensis]|uniref:CASP8-associated protein 2 n=1 Tax=Sinocyclocheilus anshuiensis TaxID=1608454 RepID=UPI0007B81A8B|nr:PREDICTED: CASP8-associated protein 2-like [Sinocyclocheilus anshuiensis]XP_016335497.1 PREDICTED: CASP8-associated protein 2-like [Sinocyclocheilus anshuiensis]XP_016335498.1 PREDICTED: CASP8-associated protein 2-like [Sinocyclocheilus anshuiensis]XP_016335499.1 PREDICTED: CASP8-associated protein 2-like [Sinocyclocheilus anshuiensis]
MDLTDEHYGDLDDKPFGTLHHNEDSVDIYSGLENSPKIDGHRGKVNPLLSPRTMESMDIYEDIIREEQEEKEATYNELKQKFDEAQKQVKELISQLQLLQTKNTSLNSENILLKKNICSVIKTAKMEIVRKDEEISRLSNRSGRGSYFRRSQMESGPANTRHSLNNPTSSVLESQGARQDNVMSEVNQHKGRNSVSDPCAYPPTTSTAATQPFEVLQRCPRTDLDSPLQCQNKSDSKTLTVQPQQESGPVHPNRTSTVADVSNAPKTSDSTLTVPDTTTDSQFSTLKDNKNSSSKQADKLEKTQKCTSRDKECNSKDKNVSQKAQRRVDSKLGRTEKELIKDNFVSTENRNQQPEVPVVLKSSEQSKSPSSQSHKASPSVSSQLSKNSFKTAADVETQSQGHMHHQNPDRTSKETKHSGLSSTTCTVVDEESHSQNHKGKKRVASSHDRKEEKRSSAERRSSRTERSRDHEQKRPKESDRSKRDEGNSSSSSKERRSNRSDSSKEYERRNIRETDNKSENKRSKKQVDACGQDFTSPKWVSQRKDAYKEKSSSKINEPSSKSKRSHSHDKARKMEDLKCPVKNGNSDKSCFGDKGIDKDRERKRGGHLDHRVHKHRESKKYLTKDDRKKSPKKHNVVGKGQDSKNEQDKHLESESSSVVAVSSSPCKTAEDNSPDRKLSFMETLNLTLSPLKKQKQSSDPKEASGATSEDASPHNSRLSDAGEEFFVIDELKNSQNRVEEVDEVPVPTTAGKKEDLTSSCKESGQVVDLSTAIVSEKPSGEQTDMDVQEENATESQEAVDKVPASVKCSEEKKNNISDSNVLDKDSLSKLTLTRESPNRVCHNTTKDSPGIIDNSVVSNILPTKTSEVVVSDNIPDSIVEGYQQRDPIIAVSEDTSPMKIQMSPQTKSQDLPPASNGICQDNVSSSDKAQSIPEINSSMISDSSVNMEVSSSTVSADLDEPRKVICDFEQVDTSKLDCKGAGEAIDNLKMIETPHSSENLKMSEKSWSENNVAPNDSTTVRDETMSSSQPGFSEPDSTEKEEQNTKSSNPVVFCPDEDSMMLTLRNIRVMPEPLSPLTSPVRQVKKVQPRRAEKQPHVKSLNKDLSAVTTGCNKDKVKMDMNKENKSPDSSVTASSYKGTKDALSASGTEEDELEDGEIVSESEEEGPLFIQTPPREKDKSTSGTDSSPKLSSVGKRVSQKKPCIPAKYSERSKSSESSSSNDSPTSSKRRFKTVSPPLKAAVYTIDGFMGMLGSIRAELRKKYMKLQKNVTKTAFCCIVDMSQASFIEFINAVDLDKLCCQGNGIKVRLNKIISSIMSKVTKNGIINRIFDQRAGDLKQKLWTFVDGQFDFLFKELKTALKSGSEPSKDASLDNKNATLKRKEIESEVVEKEPFNTSGHLHRTKMSKVDTGSFVGEAPPNNLPRRGLGSRGKNIKAVMNEDDQPANLASATSHQLPPLSSERPVHEGTSGSETRISSYVRHLSHNGSIQDKSDFEILTEQQTTSLTFNLVSDSQMGEIFKCLLQGSDLLESSVPIGDNTSWPLGTPRKEGLPGESLIGIMTPNKTTPSKFLTSWPSISPYKFASNSKMLVDPAILDESCLLEVPSNSEPCQLSLHSTVIPQKSYSILAEDLAVSLTIPSPLKSDSHLSFLHPGPGQPLSAPNSGLSAHYSEDALLDGEDATEQDIHLSLDTDNSSCGSSPSRTWEGSDPPCFQFQPNLQMQAVVMERSNDHFVVRIRRTSSGPIESNQNEGKAAPELAECPETILKPNLTLTHQDLGSAPGETSNKIPTKVNESCHISDKAIEAQPSSQKSSSGGVCDDNSSRNNAEPDSKACAIEESSTTETETSEGVSGKVKNAIQSSSAPESESERVSRKRKEHRSATKAKRQKVEKSQDKHSKPRHKKRSKSSKEKDSKIAVPQVSPSNLSAKNVIRKKGEVVVTWTRDEDRDILIELKMKGTSPKTFAALSKRLKKSTEQIEERFSQLMKLFKKKEKMEN